MILEGGDTVRVKFWEILILLMISTVTRKYRIVVNLEK